MARYHISFLIHPFLMYYWLRDILSFWILKKLQIPHEIRIYKTTSILMLFKSGSSCISINKCESQPTTQDSELNIVLKLDMPTKSIFLLPIAKIHPLYIQNEPSVVCLLCISWFITFCFIIYPLLASLFSDNAAWVAQLNLNATSPK